MVTKARYTYEDYLNTPEGERYELLDGELALVASPNEEHQLASVKLVSLMYPYVTARDLGWVFHAPFDIVFSDSEVVQPDLMFISKEREHIRSAANVRGAPDLVVEILSPSSSRRDWKYKRGLYAKYGVREYWIVDPANRIVTVVMPQVGVLRVKGAYVEGDTLASVALEGFEVGVREIF